MISVTSAWPFMKWGMDIVGPLPEGPGRVKYLIVAIDYFTKWMEAKPLATITGKQVMNFTYDNIVCRFGIPTTIITDNATHFGNGAVERANKSLLRGIKTRQARTHLGRTLQSYPAFQSGAYKLSQHRKGHEMPKDLACCNLRGGYMKTPSNRVRLVKRLSPCQAQVEQCLAESSENVEKPCPRKGK
ncbi:reverse transcriptase domain-containing protein [Tanacetum coccineum]